MVSHHNPLVREVRCLESALHDVIRLDRVIHLDLEMHHGLFSAQVIFDRQAALPAIGRDRAAQVLQEGLGICQESGSAIIFGKEVACSTGMRLRQAPRPIPGLEGRREP